MEDYGRRNYLIWIHKGLLQVFNGDKITLKDLGTQRKNN